MIFLLNLFLQTNDRKLLDTEQYISCTVVPTGTVVHGYIN